MKFEAFEQGEINYVCPVCGHQLLLPEYPYCEHLIFLHVAPTIDDSNFEFISRDFAAQYAEVLKRAAADPDNDEIEEFTDADFRLFTAPDPPSMSA